MRKDLTELVFILDRSGSMSGLEADTIGGFNAMIAKQQKEEGEAYVSTVLFDDVSELIHNRVRISEVKKMSSEDYYVRGCTALLDAVGTAIRHIGNVHKYAQEKDRPAKTLFVITTDGLENASTKYSFRDIKAMIKRQRQRYHWEFIFLGANIDAIAAAKNIGIAKDRAANFRHDAEGTALNYVVLEEVVSHVRRCKAESLSEAFAGGSWKAKIDKDFAKRDRNKI